MAMTVWRVSPPPSARAAALYQRAALSPDVLVQPSPPQNYSRAARRNRVRRVGAAGLESDARQPVAAVAGTE